MSASTGTGARWASAATAGTSPRSVRITGWMPRASSRSSAARWRASPTARRPSGGGLVAVQLGLQQPQVERQRDELLLGAVVEVALDPAAGVVGGLDDAHARDAQLLDAGAQVGLQALVVDRQRGAGGGGVDELRPGVELGVVDDRGDAAAVALDRGPGAARSRARAAAPRGRPRRRRSGARAASRRPTACGRRGSRRASRAPGPRAARSARAARATASASSVRRPSSAAMARMPAASESAHSSRPVSGPERPRADVEAVAEVADAADAEDQQPGRDRDREEPGGEADGGDRQLGRHQHEHAPVSRSVSEPIARRHSVPSWGAWAARAARCARRAGGWPGGARSRPGARRRRARRARAAARSRSR